MTRVIYVRHGETVANATRVYAGQTDFDLTERGERQAQKVADYIKEHYAVDAVYSSDLIRAINTARPIANAFGLTVQPMRELRERCMGNWEGLSHAEVLKFDPRVLEAAKTKGAPSITPEGGEPIEAVRERVYEAERKLLAQNPGACIAVVVHACVLISLARKWTQRLPNQSFLFENASVTVIDYDDEGRICDAPVVNYNGHLAEDVTHLPTTLF